MKDQPEKFNLKSHAIAEDKLEELLRLFPEVRTEGGKLDFERLKLVLGETVDVGKERYGMNWPGKADCFKTIQTPSMGTLLPCPKESVNFDTTENLIIEGDNLEVLKLLQKSYLGKVKMIYIDPPYNTGNDFIYPDDYTESLQTYLEYTGQLDAEGKKFSTNTEADGRFHSKWLNMMYPRLYLARNMLQEDGVVFISVDDGEIDNLKKLCNEVLGEENFQSMIVVQSNKRGQTYKQIAKTHEYILVYTNNTSALLRELQAGDSSLPFKDSIGQFDLWELRNRNPKFGRFNRPNLFFPIYVAPSIIDECGYAKISLSQNDIYKVEILPLNSSGQESCWRWGKQKILTSDLTSNTPVVIARQKRDGKWNIYEKSRKETKKVKSLWVETEVISEQGTIELGELGLSSVFDHPKPRALIKKCLQIASDNDGIVLDFFAGSGTTADAVFELNKEDGGNRRFILVQLPEPTRTQKNDDTWDESPAWKEGYTTITEICKERVRRVIKKLYERDESKLNLDDKKKQDCGFRVFKLAESNFKPWDAQGAQDEKTLEKQLEMHIDHLLEARTANDILYELLLKSGFTLTTPVERLLIAGKMVYSVANGALFICLEKNLTLELIRAMAAKKPERVVCLDDGFAGNDQLKTNAVQIFKTKGVNKFQTV